MQLPYDENATRRTILFLLKKSGGMTIDELSKQVSITPMGIRQHLLSLEKKGLVAYAAKKHGVGRPGFVYSLTDTANELFPKTYDRFALDMLRDIRLHEGDEKIARILEWRNERLLRLRKESLAGTETTEEKLKVLKNVLESEGQIVDIERLNGHFFLKQYNCTLSRLSAEFGEFCASELRLYQDLLGPDVQIMQSMGRGDSSCIYAIPAH